jgi:alpha-ketoglutaric semialdehyde dehydrogenase
LEVITSLVDGSWREGRTVAPDTNPARPSEIVAQVSVAGRDLAESAATAASRAAPSWRKMPPPSRGDILRRAADILESRADAVTIDFSREEGKTIGEAGGEVRRAIAILRYYAAATLAPDGETYPSHSGSTFLYARREPVGVVAAITPWNFPIAIPAWKIAPALAYGNTVVWKPASLVPLTSVHLTRALVDAGLPPGVLNLVLGSGGDVGDALVDHPAITAITFTGSNAVGRALHVRAVQHGKRVQMEMGGKNPAIVLADADLDHAAQQVARGAFLSAGQKCSATSRVIVERQILDAFQERLAALAGSWVVGDPVDPDTVVGPVVSAGQLETVLGYLDLGRSEGAQTVAGGRRVEELGPGYFVSPTVLAGLEPDSRVVREEIFGPVAAVLPAGSFEEAIAIANDTSFGLTASLFTSDLERALCFASEIRAGVVKVNQESAGVEFQVPFGGMKESSSGTREQGLAAREFFTEWKTVYLDRPPAKS